MTWNDHINYFEHIRGACGISRVDLALNCPKRDTRRPSRRFLSATCDKRRSRPVNGRMRHMTKRRGPIKGPRNDSRSAVSRSLTDTVGERIICAVNNGTTWQPIAPAYLLRGVDDPSLYYSEITAYLFSLSREEGEKKERKIEITNWRVILWKEESKETHGFQNFNLDKYFGNVIISSCFYIKGNWLCLYMFVFVPNIFIFNLRNIFYTFQQK